MGFELGGLRVDVGGRTQGFDYSFSLRVLPGDMASEGPEVVGLRVIVQDPGNVRALEGRMVGGGDSGGEDSQRVRLDEGVQCGKVGFGVFFFEIHDRRIYGSSWRSRKRRVG